VAVDEYAIRIAAPVDAAGVETLLRVAYPTLMASAYEEAWLVPALEEMTKANMCLLASGTYYLAEAGNGSVVGCGGWTPARPDNGVIESHVGHLRHFGTHPAWTYRGVGTAIYRLCEASARSVGITTFECFSSLNAEAFYSTLGFTRLRRVHVQLGPSAWLPCVLMRCHLKQMDCQ
jgi:N-acetylglutamate synthase-like GNAT family acetyltransferase